MNRDSIAYRWISPVTKGVECDMMIVGETVSIEVSGSFLINAEKQYEFLFELHELVAKYKKP